jgi:hypothetical protein
MCRPEGASRFIQRMCRNGHATRQFIVTRRKKQRGDKNILSNLPEVYLLGLTGSANT